MQDVKRFADIFKGAVNWDEFNNLESIHRLGQRAVKEISTPQMAIENISGVSEQNVFRTARNLLMAVESAQADLVRVNGISYSMALKHASVMGLEVNTDNFNTQVSKKNYQVVTENLKVLALVGLSAVIVAGLGYIIFKLVTAEKKKTKSAPEIVKMQKDVEKATEIFSSIDLKELPDAQQKKFVQLTRDLLHPVVQNSVTDDVILKDGYAVYTASAAYVASISQIEAYRLCATEKDWLVGAYLNAAEGLQEVLKDFVKDFERLSGDTTEGALVNLAVLNNRALDLDRQLKQDLGTWAKDNGVPVDQDGETWVDEVKTASRLPTRVTPDVLIRSLKGDLEVPAPDMYNRYNKAVEGLTSYGKKLEASVKKMPKEALDEDQNHIVDTIVENMKGLLGDLDILADLTRLEVAALGTTYGYKTAGAKAYSQTVFEILKDVEDKDVVKKIKDQIAKGVSQLPRKKIALESYSDIEVEGKMMALESWAAAGKFAKAAGIALLVGGSLFAIYKLVSGGKDRSKVLSDASNWRELDERNRVELIDRLEKLEGGVSGGVLMALAYSHPSGTIINTAREINKTLDAIAKSGDEVIHRAKEELAGKENSRRWRLERDHFPWLQWSSKVNFLDDLVDACGLKDSTGINQYSNELSSLFADIGGGFSAPDSENIQKALDVIGEMKTALTELDEYMTGSISVKVQGKDISAALKSTTTSERLNEYLTELVAEEAKFTKETGKCLEDIFNKKVDAEEAKEVLSKSEIGNDVIRLSKAYASFLSQCLKFLLRYTGTRIGNMHDALYHLKKVDEKTGYTSHSTQVNSSLTVKKTATEGLGSSGGQFVTGADGLDTVDEDVREYLALPEYSQAGYRFDPRDGYEGANLMATEAWSNGVKIAVGIAAAVGILGIGAIIASTLIKRSSITREGHADDKTIEAVHGKWERLEKEVGTLDEDIRDTVMAIQANPDYVATHPDWNDRIETIRHRAESTNKLEDDVGGQKKRLGWVILNDLGQEVATMRAAKLVEFNRGRKPQSLLGHDDGKWAKALHLLYDNLITKTLSSLEAGHSAERVLDEMNTFIEKKGKASYESLLEGEWGDVDYVLAQVDGNWMPQSMHNNNSVDIVTDPLAFLAMAGSGHNLLLDLNDQIGKEVEKFTVDKKLIDRFEQITANVGNRDAAASILRRIEEFKRPFALFVKALKRDQQHIEDYLNFIDRYLKSMGRHGKTVTDDLRMIRDDLAALRRDATPQ